MTSSWPTLSGRGSQADGSLVAALLAEQKNADHDGAVLRLVLLDSEAGFVACFRNPCASSILTAAVVGAGETA